MPVSSGKPSIQSKYDHIWSVPNSHKGLEFTKLIGVCQRVWNREHLQMWLMWSVPFSPGILYTYKGVCGTESSIYSYSHTWDNEICMPPACHHEPTGVFLTSIPHW